MKNVTLTCMPFAAARLFEVAIPESNQIYIKILRDHKRTLVLHSATWHLRLKRPFHDLCLSKKASKPADLEGVPQLGFRSTSDQGRGSSCILATACPRLSCGSFPELASSFFVASTHTLLATDRTSAIGSGLLPGPNESFSYDCRMPRGV